VYSYNDIFSLWKRENLVAKEQFQIQRIREKQEEPVTLYCIIDKSKIENILIVLRLKQLPHDVINQTKVRA
jgi:hypothetical protein